MKKLTFRKNVQYLPYQPKPLPSLAKCVLMDIIGSAVAAIPLVGEILWAPISALVFWRMFGFSKGFFGGIFSFVEELIPGINFIPTFTIMWFVQYAKRKKETMTLKPTIIR